MVKEQGDSKTYGRFMLKKFFVFIFLFWFLVLLFTSLLPFYPLIYMALFKAYIFYISFRFPFYMAGIFVLLSASLLSSNLIAPSGVIEITFVSIFLVTRIIKDFVVPELNPLLLLFAILSFSIGEVSITLFYLVPYGEALLTGDFYSGMPPSVLLSIAFFIPVYYIMRRLEEAF